MRVLELFAGYGSQALALENLGIEFVSDISEIDPYAIKAYNQIHGETHNWGDITKIDETQLPHYDLITYSSPCQDFSVAGLGRGGDEGSGTRSSLLWECERIIRAVKPKYLLMENVKNLVGEKHKHNFIRWLRVLEMMGYWNFWQVLNAKDYGIPQNRERVFVVSILGGGQYLFPNKIKLEKRLKDILEPNVDEKYYLSDDLIGKLSANIQKDVCGTIRCGGRGSLDKNHSWDIVAEPLACASRGRNPENPSDRTVGAPTEQRLEINSTGCTNTLTSVQKDNYIIEPFIADDTQGFDDVRYYNNYSPTLRSERSGLKIVEPLRIKEATQKGYAEAYEYDSVSLEQPNSKTRRGRVGKQISNTLTCSCNMGIVEPKVIQVGNIVSTGNWDNPQIGRVYSIEGCNSTLNTCGGGNHEPKITEGYRIRKLTPRECWRLMGVKDEQFDRLHDISNTQLYKMAGNSIVVDVLMAIFRNLFISDKETKGQLTLF